MIKIDRKELKVRARETLRETRPSPVLVTLMVGAALIVVGVLWFRLSGYWDWFRAMLDSAREAYDSMLAGIEDVQITIPDFKGSDNMIGSLLTIALELMVLVMPLGYLLYILRLIRKKKPSFGDVFDVFGFFFRAIWFSILRSLIISVWSIIYFYPMSLLGTVMPVELASVVCLPLLAPMIMAAYGYRLAPFIMLEDRKYGCLQCLGLSRLAMRGRKWELFLLDLSFLGWMILGVVPFTLLWTVPYWQSTVALWYDGVMPEFRKKIEQDLAKRQADFFSGFQNSRRDPQEPRDESGEDARGGEEETGGSDSEESGGEDGSADSRSEEYEEYWNGDYEEYGSDEDESE